LDKVQLLAGARSALPIIMGYLPLGFAYGVLARSIGLTVLETVAMSVIVYAGSSQFIAVGLLAAQASPLTIIFTTFLVNLRHLLMSASLVPYLRGVSQPLLALIAYELTDESFAVATTYYQEHQASPYFQLGLNFTAQVAWVTSSLVGATVGNLIEEPARYGLDFALPAMFVALLVMQLKNKGAWLVAAVGGGLAAVIGASVPGNWHIMIATVVAATLGVVSEKWIPKS